MTLRRYLLFAGLGWLAAAGMVLALGVCSVAVFPGIVRFAGASVTLLGLPSVVLVPLLLASLPGMVGGLLGGRIPIEGGAQDQWQMAAICGVLAAVPFACFVLWSLTGR